MDHRRPRDLLPRRHHGGGQHLGRRRRELAHILKHSDADALICARPLPEIRLRRDARRARAARRVHAAAARRVIHVGARGYRGLDPVRRRVRARPRRRGRGASTRRAAAVDPSDVAYILYTSGSTSTPKGVQLQHYALIENMWHIGERMHVHRAGPAVARGVAVLGARLRERAVQPDDAWRLRGAAGAFRAGRGAAPHRATSAARSSTACPTWRRPCRASRPRRNATSACLRAGGTIGTPEQFRRIVELGAKEICHIYGLTETYGNCNVADGGSTRATRASRRSAGRSTASTSASSIPRPAASCRRPDRRDPDQGLRDDRLLQGRGQEPRGLHAGRLFPHRRSRFPRRGRAACTSAAA